MASKGCQPHLLMGVTRKWWRECLWIKCHVTSFPGHFDWLDNFHPYVIYRRLHILYVFWHRATKCRPGISFYEITILILVCLCFWWWWR